MNLNCSGGLTSIQLLCCLHYVIPEKCLEKNIYTNGRLDWLISGHQNAKPSRKAFSILSGKFKRFTFVHPALLSISLYKGGTAFNLEVNNFCRWVHNVLNRHG